MAAERTGLFTWVQTPVTLVGNPVSAGDKAPDFKLLNAQGRAPVTLADFAGKVLIIAAVPSLDTGVCDAETRRFNQEAAALGDDIRVLTVSVDLPEAQKRWCGAAGVENITVASDYLDTNLGLSYGIMIKERRQLARAVFVVDKQGTVRHAEIVPVVTQQPQFEDVLAAAKSAR